MEKIIEDLNWRYAVDQFDPGKKVKEDELRTIVEAARLAPSSYGLQPLKLLVIEDIELRKNLLKASFNQQQVLDCSHLLVICAYSEITAEYIDEHIALCAAALGRSIESYERYSDYLKRTILQMPSKEMSEWNARQAYIALGHILHTCAQLRIDSTPMEGFQKEVYDELLELKTRNLRSIVACPVGHRSENDDQQFWPKIRRSTEDFVEFYS